MKKLKFFAVLFFVICTMAIFASCGGKLDAPTGVMETEENEIAWSPVEDAYRYLVQFQNTESDDKPKELKTKDNKISVSEFELDEGWYDVRVKALSGESDDNNSDWSEALRYYKIYESRCEFTLVNNVEYHVTASLKAKGDVIIESTYNGKPVTRIAEGAFKSNTRITSVTIGDYVEAIDKNAFYGCSQLKSVTLSKSLKTVGESAFQSCRELTSVQFFDELVSIEKSAFAYCRKLQTLDLGASVLAVGESAFFGCSLLEKIEIPDSVQFIGEKAFSNCEAAQSVYIGKGITEIGSRTFYENTSLKTITFAEGIQLEMIADLAFYQCFLCTDTRENIGFSTK
ncbi:MAG: leucine-rich repeat domain-containing protein [Clostridia bacterium]|nr:leucine-rich repeat domain-containing protein [Clostridia bacterium]